MIKLVFNDQSGWERSVEIGDHKPTVTIGRNGDCDIQTSNTSVSRVHAMLTWRDGKLFVQDPPNSRPTNGTKVDGVRLQPGEVLEVFPGSELLCGNFSIKVVAEAGMESMRPLDGSQIGGTFMAPQFVNGRMVMPPSSQSVQGPQNLPPQNLPPQNLPPQNLPPQNLPPQNPRMAQGRQGNQNAQMSGMMPMGPSSQGAGGSMDHGRANRSSSRMPYVPGHVGVQGGSMAQAIPGSLQAQMQPVVAQPVMTQPPMQPVPSSQIMSGVSPSVQVPSMMNAGGMPVSQSGISKEEYIRIQDELLSTKRELDEALSTSASKDDTIHELQQKLSDRDQIMTDYERRSEYHESVVTGLKEMIDKLKEQLDHQKDQYQECKKDLVTAQDEAESLRMELTTLKETLESKGMATSNAETAIAELKVQLTQKNRALSDLQRELDLAQFSCKEERENVDRLKENVDTLNAALEESQRHNRDMKKVVEQHEVAYDELRSNLDDRAREIRQLQDSLRAQGGGDMTALLQELSQVRDSLNGKIGECELLKKQMAGLREEVMNSEGDRAELEELRARVSELERQPAQPVMDNGELDALRHNCDKLKLQLENVLQEKAALESAAGSHNNMDNGLLEILRGLYTDINDVVSQWREDLNTLENNINDLQRVFVAYVKIDIQKIAERDRLRLESVLAELDPKLIFEDIGNSLDSGQNSLAEIKGKLKELRGALQV